ncbi:SIR2 family NAD-dependent protein deacylase [Terriglobus albidus]|uniref:SIR2 family NAD-dependent protein deacylase n=1 Tax=Terriglobus albidus TaxID=1592106 RepID=UPI00164E2A02|nr:SIR2 family protein [Terriglobus albidus]
MTINELPDFAAIEQVNSALWRAGRTRGAAVLVGAGFSRNAERLHDGAPLPPDWWTLTKALQTRLGYPAEDYKDPLRIAEEFIANLGRSALDSLLKELVPDQQWLPSKLHRKLVSLKWVDILTTNWDTLLERAASANLGQSYDVVRCLEDLATTRAPRIVKLHGSLPANRPFILSEEDYRTYPRRFAPFVNLVQQVLLENELCLVGFSGEDPNFLEWSGWIRDHLGVSARRIYLVGVLNLRPAQRTLLEQRNISPIDLGPLVDGIDPSRRHETALELLLDYFHNNKPPASWHWKAGKAGALPQTYPLPPHETLVERLKTVPEEWLAERQSYPGWAVCPQALRDGLRQHTFEWLHQRSVIESSEPKVRGRFAYEAVWRCETGLFPIGHFSELLGTIVESSECWTEMVQRDFVAVALLRSARSQRNEIAFQKWSNFLEARQQFNPDLSSQLVYQKALWALEGLDFADLEALATQVDGPDPLWNLKKAALYAELGDQTAARAFAIAGYAKAREQYLRDRDSIWALSRFAWAKNIAPRYRGWDDTGEDTAEDKDSSSIDPLLHETMCRPWDWFSDLDAGLRKSLSELDQQLPIVEPRFDVGTYRQRGNVLFFGAWPAQPLFDCFSLSETIGIPIRIDGEDFFADRIGRADRLGEVADDSDFLRIIRTIQADNEAPLEHHFGRLAVARLSEQRITWILEVLTAALRFGLERLKHRKGWADQFWSRRCAQYAEMISRIVVRLDESRARDIFKAAIEYAHDPRWHWRELCDALGHLIERSISAIPPANRGALLTPLLYFPIPDEIGLPEHLQQEWPDASAWLGKEVLIMPSDTNKLTERIDTLIARVKVGTSTSRAQAANRLIRLHIDNFLNPGQTKSFSETLWSRRSDVTGFPSETSLYPHVFLNLPFPPDATPFESIKKSSAITDYSEYVTTLANVAKYSIMQGQAPKLLFSKEEGLALLEKYLEWRPSQIAKPDINRVAEKNQRTLQGMAVVIADQILPLYSPGELSTELIDQCLTHFAIHLEFSPLLPELVRVSPTSHEPAIRLILDAILSNRQEASWSGCNAAYRWIRGWKDGALPEVPRSLVDGLLWIIEARSEPGRHHAMLIAIHLTKSNILSLKDFERLSHALGLALKETDYRHTRYTSRLTLFRASCVRLAAAIRDANFDSEELRAWIALDGKDPLPEVRYALSINIE